MSDVDIVIPVHNGSRFLLETLRSIEKQDYPDFRIILIDDGSTDQSKELINTFIETSSINILFIENLINIGLSSTLWKGIKKSKSTYVMIMSQDDVLQENHISSAIRAIERVDAIAFSPNMVVQTNQRFANQWISAQTSHNYGWPMLLALMGMNVFNVPGSIIKRNYLKQEMFHSSNVLCQDWEMWLMLSFEGKIIGGGAPIRYRLHDSNMHLNVLENEFAFDVHQMFQRLIRSGKIQNKFEKLSIEEIAIVDDLITIQLSRLRRVSNIIPLLFEPLVRICPLLIKTESLIQDIFKSSAPEELNLKIQVDYESRKFHLHNFPFALTHEPIKPISACSSISKSTKMKVRTFELIGGSLCALIRIFPKFTRQTMESYSVQFVARKARDMALKSISSAKFS